MPSTGSASRVSSFANVVLPHPVAPTMATLAPAGTRMVMPCSTRSLPGYAYRTSSASTSRAPRGSSTPAAGSWISTGRSSTDRILRHPAIAVCVSL